jgi:regulator of sirC expression with transglutaminase-like and TPR domain
MRLLPEDPAEYLRQLGEAGDGPHDIAGAALMFAALDHFGRDLSPHITHLAEIAEQARLESRMAVNAEDGARALAGLLAGRYGYDGDRLAYDDPQNADLICVIDRRRGLPVTLGILYLHAARASGFDAAGLNSPGHFLLRIGFRGSHALIDPYNGGAALERERLGAPPSLRTATVEEDRARQAVEDVEILLRLGNNQKLRAMQAGEMLRALEIGKRMVLIAPRRAELWLDLAQLHEEEGTLGAARDAYDACLVLADAGAPLHNEAALRLQGLKRQLN